jgi:hypothetical protein
MRGILENFCFPSFSLNAKVALLQQRQKHFHAVTDEGVHKTQTKATNVTIPAQRVNARRKLPLTRHQG